MKSVARIGFFTLILLSSGCGGGGSSATPTNSNIGAGSTNELMLTDGIWISTQYSIQTGQKSVQPFIYDVDGTRLTMYACGVTDPVTSDFGVTPVFTSNLASCETASQVLDDEHWRFQCVDNESYIELRKYSDNKEFDFGSINIVLDGVSSNFNQGVCATAFAESDYVITNLIAPKGNGDYFKILLRFSDPIHPGVYTHSNEIGNLADDEFNISFRGLERESPLFVTDGTLVVNTATETMVNGTVTLLFNDGGSMSVVINGLTQ